MRTRSVVIALLLAVLPLAEGGANAAGLFMTHTLVFVLAGMALWDAKRRGGAVLGLGWESVAGVALVAWLAVSFLGVDYAFGSFLSLWNAAIVLLLALVLHLSPKGQGAAWKRLPAAAVAGSSALQAVLALVVAPPPNLTPAGTFANANQLAAYLDMGAFVAAALAIDFLRRRGREGGGARRWLAAALLAVAALDVAALLHIGSRGGIGALLIVAGLWIAFSAPPGRWRQALAVGLAVLALAAAASVMTRFERIGDPYRFDRVRIWAAGLSAARDHPVLGMGPGMFERRGYAYNFPLDREPFRYSKNLGSTHSTWLQALVETGAVGLLIALLLAGLLLLRLRGLEEVRQGGAAAGAALALICCLVQGIADTPFEVPAISLSLVALLAPPLARASGPGSAAIRVRLPADGRTATWPAMAVIAWTGTVAWCGAVLLPYVAHVEFARGVAASAPGRIDAALDRAVGLNPLNPLYPSTRAMLIWRRDRPLDPDTLARVQIDLERAARLDPGNPEHPLGLARLHARAWFEVGASPAAAARATSSYRAAIALGKPDPRPHLELASLLMALGRAREGLSEMQEALRIEPRFLGARLARARALLEIGDREAAREDLARFERTVDELQSWQPRNGYERDLMRVDPAAFASLRDSLR